ncbi:O-methyltransferase COMT-type [Parasponia andersonii]|uniref:O-methyltransferase COMT-type n=1 Tax=Parasponia andersonii TaxID=3476 RepID=A0A2P5B4H9_PARAD|nr:O-methyltransferase COMT-type [Parasponia andersonii]
MHKLSFRHLRAVLGAVKVVEFTNFRQERRFSHFINKDLIIKESSSVELLKAHAFIWNRMFSFINSMSLRCAIQLGIPDAIHNHGKPMNLPQLLAALPIHQTKAPFVRRLMRILVHSGFFTVEKVSEIDVLEEGYILTNASRLLLKDHPLSVAPFVLGILDPIVAKPYHHMSSWFQNDSPTAFHTAYGMNIWDYTCHEPKLAHLFNQCMESDSRLVSSVLMKECKQVFDGIEKFVDVGGGTGTVAKAIADTFPHLECIVLDLPHVVADLEGTKNMTFLGGDMFDALPSADAILLKWILHDWNDEESLKILLRCKEAITSKGNHKKGKVIIIDMVMRNKNESDDDDQSVETQLFFDMHMMVLLTGKQRNEEEWAKLFCDAGFSSYKITPILGLRSLIELYP